MGPPDRGIAHEGECGVLSARRRAASARWRRAGRRGCSGRAGAWLPTPGVRHQPVGECPLTTEWSRRPGRSRWRGRKGDHRLRLDVQHPVTGRRRRRQRSKPAGPRLIRMALAGATTDLGSSNLVSRQASHLADAASVIEHRFSVSVRAAARQRRGVSAPSAIRLLRDEPSGGAAARRAGAPSNQALDWSARPAALARAQPRP